ncbi:hypothetical protein [Aurantiacibacter odishensis]|uniref:hypothetical protein n=1 Tax=Aurantiacibacter odishensis TaxID=1155476 RepID=UPI000E722A98|nr:hypothetical protein [Aurantiacibacter odishensis]
MRRIQTKPLKSRRTLGEASGALVLPVAIIVSFVVALALDQDWWAIFGITLGVAWIAQGIVTWFAAPDGTERGKSRSHADVVVPREAKLGALAALAVVGGVVLLISLL